MTLQVLNLAKSRHKCVAEKLQLSDNVAGNESFENSGIWSEPEAQLVLVELNGLRDQFYQKAQVDMQIQPARAEEAAAAEAQPGSEFTVRVHDSMELVAQSEAQAVTSIPLVRLQQVLGLFLSSVIVLPELGSDCCMAVSEW